MITNNTPLYFDGQWQPSTKGTLLNSINPSTGELVWEGHSATEIDVDNAVKSAKSASASWALTPISTRQDILFAFAKALQDKKQELAELIADEMGKPTWEALQEVQASIGKIAISIEAFQVRCRDFSAGTAVTRFKPHGVVAVYGTYNFPIHIANGHIIPALLAGNTIVFKPSELTPACAEAYLKIWEKTNLPNGVLNMVQGERETGIALSTHKDLNGIYFTGSARAGLAIQKANIHQPEKIIALEMGGNNPLIVHNVKDTKAAALMTIQSAYATSGQRCTCARRLIIPHGTEGDHFIDTLIQLIPQIQVNTARAEPAPFMGPVVSTKVAQEILNAQTSLAEKGGNILVQCKLLEPNSALLTPGLIDVTNIKNLEDEEIFGPILQVIRKEGLAESIIEANNTRYGLSSGIFTDDEDSHRLFYDNTDAGIINWNQPLTGASSAAPFGGTGISGNHRPTAFFAADYCSYPVTSVESPTLSMPESLPPGIVI